MKEGFSQQQRRGELIYTRYLFPDDIIGNPLANRITKALAKRLGTELYDNFEFYGSHSTWDEQFETFTTEEVCEKFGGKKEFFKKGARILDLGSRAGLATAEFSSDENDIKVVGLEKLYKERRPVNPSQGYYVSGKEHCLPFEDDTFTGIMALESFPAHMSDGNLLTSDTFNEITRVSKEGAVYRATTPRAYLPDYAEEFKHRDKLRIINYLAISGWETFYTRGLLIAKLVEKPRKPSL